MSELIDNRKYRIKLLRELIMELHKGKSVEEVKKKFREAVKGVSHEEVAAMEQELIQEGLPVEEIQRMCDVHASIFKESLDEALEPDTIPGHPVHTFKLENEAIEKLISKEIKPLLDTLKKASPEEEKGISLQILEKVNLLMDIDKHYSRKENLLFPYLEKNGITAPPKVMWGVDDEIREELKQVKALLREYINENKEDVLAKTESALNRVQEMVFKEEKILFPMAMERLTEDEWYEIYNQSDEIGYCLVEPTGEWKTERVTLEKSGDVIESEKGKGLIKFDTGILSAKEIELIFNHMPVDITFVDKNDLVKYFSAGKERIFTRTKTVIGRKVQNCHPPASVHVVEKIVQDFKDGKKDMEEFWINMGGKMIYIRYFAVRDKEGEYVGTLEVTQNINRIRSLEEEKRLAD